MINTGAYDELPPTSAAPSSSFALLLVLLGASTATTLGHHILLHHVDDLVWDSQILNGASSDVALGHPPEFVSILRGTNGGHNIEKVSPGQTVNIFQACFDGRDHGL